MILIAIRKHNHDVFTKLHSLLETFENENNDKLAEEFLVPLETIELDKNTLYKACEHMESYIRYTKDHDSKNDKPLCDLVLDQMMDEMMENMAVGVKIDINFEESQYKLKDFNEMENSLRMLFGDTLKSKPLATPKSYEIIYHTKYTKKDEIVFEKSFHGSEYDEQSNESTPFKQVKCSGAIPKSNALIINDTTLQLPFIPRYNSSRKNVDQRSNQIQKTFKNVESQIVQIVSAESLCSIQYKTNTSSKLKLCSIFNMALFNATNISYQKDIIRYFLVK